MKQILSKLFSESGEISSKRVITFLSAFVIFAIAFINMFTGKVIAEFIFDGLMWITLAGIGSIATEKFSPKSKQPPTTTTDEV